MFSKVYENIKKFIISEWKPLLFIILFALITNLRLPYIIEAPGGAVDLTDRVIVDTDNKAQGTFNMAYVTSITGTPLSLFIAGIRSDWDIVKTSDITLDGEDYEDSVERDRLYLQEAKENAIIAAYNAAGATINIKNFHNKVIYIGEEANTDLKIGDVILRVDGTECHDLESIKALIQTYDALDEVTLDIVRDNKEMTAKAKLYGSSDGTKIGLITVLEHEIETEPEIEVKYKSSESGPSGGLMTALEIYNRLTEDDLTKGRKIIGTGTIDDSGNVGEIGGVKYKLAGAVKEKAAIFLCPLENYDEAKELQEKKKYDIKVIGVATLSDAINELKDGSND